MTKSAAKLIDVILTVWTKSLPAPYGSGEYSAAVDGQTDCNRFVNEVAQKLGYNKLVGMRANQMADFFSLNYLEWLEVSGEVAQTHANDGAFVVAAWKNPVPEKSGHVCVVIPGVCVTSGKWGIAEPKVPKVANVGTPDKCRVDRGANYAFNEIPKYYALKGTL